MPFDSKKFLGAQLAPREKDVPVPDLAAWFGEDAPAWRVRGLEGREMARARAAKENYAVAGAMLEGMASRLPEDIRKTVRAYLGDDDKQVPSDVAYRMELLILGSVEPACTLDVAKKLCRAFPVTFYQLTNEILTLSGRGFEETKKKSSSKTPGSAAPSPSDTAGASRSTSSSRTSSRKGA